MGEIELTFFAFYVFHQLIYSCSVFAFCFALVFWGPAQVASPGSHLGEYKYTYGSCLNPTTHCAAVIALGPLLFTQPLKEQVRVCQG